jgi:hypothetical protein
MLQLFEVVVKTVIKWGRMEKRICRSCVGVLKALHVAALQNAVQHVTAHHITSFAEFYV